MTERERIIESMSDVELLMFAMLGGKAKGPAGRKQVEMLNELQQELMRYRPPGRKLSPATVLPSDALDVGSTGGRVPALPRVAAVRESSTTCNAAA